MQRDPGTKAAIVKFGFRQGVITLVRSIPLGHVSTYGDIATMLGSPRAARQVGFALAGLGEDTDVPWHRVINAQGRISFRGDDLRGILQRKLLEIDGIKFDERGKIDLLRLRWRVDPDQLEALITETLITEV